MKESTSLFSKYAALWGILLGMIFIFLYATLPSLEMNHYLNNVRAKRLEEIEKLQRVGKRLQHLKWALEKDPITIEGTLRQRFNGALREGEVEVDRLVR